LGQTAGFVIHDPGASSIVGYIDTVDSAAKFEAVPTG
jgi:hypothetical protein